MVTAQRTRELCLPPTPKQFKMLGRKITPFDETVWNAHKKEIVVNGNLAKFSQNEALKSFLLSTRETILVEASPYDTVWGIGMAENYENVNDPHLWQGENNLGFALMEVRDVLTGV